MWSRNLVVVIALASMLGSDLAVGSPCSNRAAWNHPAAEQRRRTYGKVLPGPARSAHLTDRSTLPADAPAVAAVRRSASGGPPVQISASRPGVRTRRVGSAHSGGRAAAVPAQAPTPPSRSHGVQGAGHRLAADRRRRAPAAARPTVPTSTSFRDRGRLQSRSDASDGVPGFQRNTGPAGESAAHGAAVHESTTARRERRSRWRAVAGADAAAGSAAAETRRPIRRSSAPTELATPVRLRDVRDETSRRSRPSTTSCWPDYVMGPGDDLTINVWGAVDSTLIRTGRNGRIVLPKVGDLRIWGHVLQATG